MVGEVDSHLTRLIAAAEERSPDVERKKSRLIEVGTWDSKPVRAGRNDKVVYLLFDGEFYNPGEGISDPASISLEQAQEIITRQKEQKQKAIVRQIGKRYTIKKGQFGLYVTDGTTNATLPEGTEVETLDAKDCAELIKKKRKKT